MSTMPAERPRTSGTGRDTAPAAGNGAGTEPADPAGTAGAAPEEKDQSAPLFILYMEGPAYASALRGLTLWVHHVLLPVYGREVTSGSPWCPTWWEHPEAVAQLHGLWLAWGDLTGPGSTMTGPASWHRDYLSSVMDTLRDPQGPFAGCKPGMHRPKDTPKVAVIDPFAPPPAHS